MSGVVPRIKNRGLAPLHADLGKTMIESDRVYFEAGSELVRIPGGLMATMPGLEGFPLGRVLHRLSPGELEACGKDWISQVEETLFDAGASGIRIYLEAPEPSWLALMLTGRGFQSRNEFAYLLVEEPPETNSEVRLRPLNCDADWAAKLRIHEKCRFAPDGYQWPAEKWLEMERIKTRDPAMELYLIESRGEVVGSLGEIETDLLIRAKNLVIDPQRRNEGLASQALRLLWLSALLRGKIGIGVFAIAGRQGEALYRKLGMRRIATWREWSRPPEAKGWACGSETRPAGASKWV